MSDQEEDLAQQSEDGERDDGERDDGEEAADPEEENEGDDEADEADEADEDERPKTGASQRPETAKSVQVVMRITDGHFGQIQLGRLVHSYLLGIPLDLSSGWFSDHESDGEREIDKVSKISDLEHG